MEDKLAKQLKEPTQVIYREQEPVTAPNDCGEGPVHVSRGSDG